MNTSRTDSGRESRCSGSAELDSAEPELELGVEISAVEAAAAALTGVEVADGVVVVVDGLVAAAGGK